jgi:hypothetical protein
MPERIADIQNIDERAGVYARVFLAVMAVSTRMFAMSPNEVVVATAINVGRITGAPFSVPSICTLTGLSRGTVRSVIDKFEGQGWVMRLGNSKGLYTLDPLGFRTDQYEDWTREIDKFIKGAGGD